MHKDYSQSEETNESFAVPGRSVIGLFPNARKAHEAGLAVLAAGSPYWVYPFDEKFALVVDSKRSEQMEKEIKIYQSRNRFWPPVSVSLPEKKISPLPTAGFVLLLVFIFLLQGYYPKLDDVGMTSSQAFREGSAWWRLFTAMTLHADIAHLTGNLFGIGLFGYFSARYLGSGLAWLCIVIGAALANLTNVIMHFNDSYLSLGASTAVFAALGLVTGFPVGSYLRSGRYITNRQWIIPLSGGLMLLAWLGSGSYPTDVAGHLWAFLYGLLIAVLMAKLKIHALVSKNGQLWFLALAWILLGIAWYLAIQNS